jgi:hypothetical protein
MPSQPRSSNPGAAPFASASLSVSESLPSIFFLGRWLADLTLATLLFTVISVAVAHAQEPIAPLNDDSAQASAAALPFEVSNPRHKKWPETEAGRIYTSACDLLARSIHPEHPPQLRPKFRLVLGTDHDEFVRDGSIEELHLRSWDPEKFAQGVVVVALRELVSRPDLARLARLSVTLAGSTIDVSDLRSHER